MKKIFCMLTGGLGNQMFQYAAALDRDSDLIILETSLGIPRFNEHGEPIISDFILDEKVIFSKKRKKFLLASKSANYLLRCGINPKFIEKFNVLNSFSKRLGSVVISLWLRNRVRVIQATDLGFFEIKPSNRDELHLGYFQSFIWSENPKTKHKLQSMSLKVVPDSLKSFLYKNAGKKSISIHVRLGDYKNQPGFGLLPKTYYSNAIEILMRNSSFEVIWLFSDEPKEAVKLIPGEYLGMTVMVPDFDDSASVTLEAMRHADAYVIANSSLSWWGARLSYSSNPKVIAPHPWFENDPEPSFILPNEWTRLNAWESFAD